MLRHRFVMPLVVAAVLATGCGGDDGDEGAGGTTAPPATTATSAAPTTVDPALEARAKAAVLQATDFPPGWEVETEEEGLELQTVWTEVLGCLGVESAPQGAMATSPTFRRGLATQVRSTVEYTTPPAAAAVSAAFAGPKFEECAKEAVAADAKRSAPEGGVPGPVQMAPLDFPSLGGGQTSAYRFNVTIGLDELQVPIFQDLVTVFDGGTVIRILFLNPGSAFPQELQRSLAQAVVGRA